MVLEQGGDGDGGRREKEMRERNSRGVVKPHLEGAHVSDSLPS